MAPPKAKEYVMTPEPTICVFTRTWLSSGAGLFAQELAQGLLDSGAAVTFVAPRAEKDKYETPHPRLRRIRQPRERRDDAGKFARVAASLARVGGGFLGLMRARLTNKIFIVTIADPLVFAVPMLAILRATGAKIIFVAHDPLPHAWSFPARLQNFEKWLHGACYDLAARVVVLSEPSAVKLREAYPRMTRPVAVIEHGVFLLDHDSEPLGAGQLLAFGSIRRNKGFIEAIEGTILAARRGVAVRLLIAGEPHKEDPDYCRDCLALAATAPEIVTARVGYVDDAELDRVFAETDALLMPYQDFFSQSGVAVLAASNGRPIVAARSGGVGELIAQGMPAAEIATPVTAETVASAIENFYRRPIAEWRVAARDFRDLTRSKWSWRAIGRKYLELARELGDD